eukprot:SAG31_NODE_3059_length_4678_cov_1.833657_5_plen_79_part_00
MSRKIPALPRSRSSARIRTVGDKVRFHYEKQRLRHSKHRGGDDKDDDGFKRFGKIAQLGPRAAGVCVHSSSVTARSFF